MTASELTVLHAVAEQARLRLVRAEDINLDPHVRELLATARMLQTRVVNGLAEAKAFAVIEAEAAAPGGDAPRSPEALTEPFPVIVLEDVRRQTMARRARQLLRAVPRAIYGS